MFITLTFLLFNLCNKNLKLNESFRKEHKCLWIFSLIICLITDYRCFELFTRTKIEIVEENDENNKRDKRINIDNNKDNYDLNNLKNNKNKINKNKINNLDITSNENDITNANLKTGIVKKRELTEKDSTKRNYLEDNDDNNILSNLNKKK